MKKKELTTKQPVRSRLLEWIRLRSRFLTIALLIVAALLTSWWIAYRIGQENIYSRNREMLANAPTATLPEQTGPTCPGIADLAGNCMEQVVYSFTITDLPAQTGEPATPTPAPVCTPESCLYGELVCPDDVICVNGCGYVCVVDQPTQIAPQEPDWVCLYYYQTGRRPLQRCYTGYEYP